MLSGQAVWRYLPAMLPDANILTMTDFFNAASSMNEAVNIPVIADCDTGFGNSKNVIHLVKKYEAAEIAAVCIEDITILIDSSYDSKHVDDNRRKELVVVEGTTLKAKRSLHSNELRRIEKIGSDLDSAQCQSEFPGIAFLSKSGVETVTAIYNSSLRKYSGKPFCSVDKFENALFSDLLQEIINSDFPVYGMEANSGWLEIHSFEDYKMACSMLK